MGGQFSLMDDHVEAPSSRPPGGKVVLSRLTPGRSMIGAPAPSLKLVLEGEELYQVDGRTMRVQPGQFLYLDAGEDCVAINRTRTYGLCLTIAHGARCGSGGSRPGAWPVPCFSPPAPAAWGACSSDMVA